MDQMLERAKRLADEAQAREKEAAETKERLQQERKRQEQNLSNAETLARAGKEVDDQKEKMALSEIKLMLLQPEEVRSFLDNAERQVSRYERFKENRDAALGKLPQTEENKAKMESISKNAQDSYGVFYDAYQAIPNDGPWKLKTDEVHAEQWKNMMAGVKALALNLDAFDKLTGDYSETAKLYMADANRYASGKKEDAEWKAAIDREFADNWAKRTAFFTENPDPSKDTEEVKAIRAILVDAERLFDTNQPKFKTDENARGATFLAKQQMTDALNMYETYKAVQKQLPTETAVAAAAPSPEKSEPQVDLTMEKGGILVTGKEDGMPSYVVPSTHPAFNIAADRRDTAFKILDKDGTVMELSQGDWEKVGGLKDGSWRKANILPVGEAVARRTNTDTEIAANQPPVQPKAMPAPEVKVPAPNETASPKQEETKQQPAKEPLAKMESVQPEPKQVVVEPTAVPTQKIPTVEEKKEEAVPPVKMEQPAVATEKVPEAIKAVLKQDGSIDVPTQETIYIAYYLPNGERHRNYVRFPSSEVARWTIDGMCVAERSAKGWTVRPEAGLTGALLFNVGGSTSIIKLPENAKGTGLAQPLEQKDVIVDPDFPILSRLSNGK